MSASKVIEGHKHRFFAIFSVSIATIMKLMIKIVDRKFVTIFGTDFFSYSSVFKIEGGERARDGLLRDYKSHFKAFVLA